MKTSFVSSAAISQAMRYSLIRSQGDLVKAQKEVSTGKVADAGLALGARTAQSISFARDLERLNGIVDSNGLVSSRLSATQKALDQIAAAAQDFLADADLRLVRRRALRRHPASGEATLEALTAHPEHQLQRRAPLRRHQHRREAARRFHAPPARTAKAAFDAAFLAHFGFAQNDPAAASITAAQMDSLPHRASSRSSSAPAGRPTGRTPPTRRSSAASRSTRRRRPRSAPTTTACASSPWPPRRSATCSSSDVSVAGQAGR